jgi:hypothetical protein
MEAPFWNKQHNTPLFPELEWNKPERRDQAGKMLIVGGTVHELSAPARAFEYVTKIGIGSAKVALPHKTKRLVGPTLPEAVFLPSTTSGEFSSETSRKLLEYALWADTVLFAGENGRNSQTTMLFEEFLRSYNGNVVITKDAIDILSNHPTALVSRDKTILVASFAQLQKLVQNFGFTSPLTFTMSLVQLVDFLHDFTAKHRLALITLHSNQLVAASNGRVSTTKLTFDTGSLQWRLRLAALAACFSTWNPHQPFESITEAAFIFAEYTPRNS